MPVLKFSLARLQARLGRPVAPDALKEAIPALGAALEAADGDAWAVEFFPNRPDLLSVDGLARALRAFLGIQPGIPKYETAPGPIEVTVDPSVRKVRPAIACGVAHDVPMDEAALLEIMGLQEDLHWGPGARRRKVSIGIHDLSGVTPPFVYRAADPDRVRFVPLHSDEEMTMREVVTRHEKGVAFRHLVEGFDRWPVIEDAEHEVLSFPPIINGRATTLTPSSRELFIDVTGTDERACGGVLGLVATHLAEMGARLETVTVKTGRRRLVTPALAPTRHRLRPAVANRLLGTSLTEGQMAAALGRMGLEAEPARGGLSILVPAYRLDVLHEVDLIEDVAVGHGYASLKEQAPRDVVFGAAMPSEPFWDRARRTLIGLGFLECMTLTLVGGAVAAQAVRGGIVEPERVRVQNPVSIDHDRLRASLLPSLLETGGHNVHRELPQALFEIGDVIVPPPASRGARPINERRVAGLVVASDAAFTGIKRVAEALLREMGYLWREAPADHGAFVPGRCAAVTIVGAKDATGADAARVPAGVAGHYGELAPEVITAFGLANPAVAFEFRLRPYPAAEVWAPPDDALPPP